MKKGLVALASLLVLAGCQASTYRLPTVGTAEILAVDREMKATSPTAWRPELSEWDARQALRRGWVRVHATAVEVCREMQRDSCRWWLDFNESRDIHAWSHRGGRIEVQLGRADQSNGDDPIALTMAHEMAHKILDHAALSRPWVVRGWYLGDAAGRTIGLLGALGGYSYRRLVRFGRFHGRDLGFLVRSRIHEREADYFAVLIAYRAGVDLEGARKDWSNSWRDRGRIRSTILDTHPVGAERIAQYDRAVAEVRASGGKLPPRATELLGWLAP